MSTFGENAAIVNLKGAAWQHGLRGTCVIVSVCLWSVAHEHGGSDRHVADIQRFSQLGVGHALEPFSFSLV